ncbi:MAG: serine/threonine-protein kinase, partial [Myxococcota bacterium]
MPQSVPIDDELAKLGQIQVDDPPELGRKFALKARLFGDPEPTRRIGRFVDLGLLGYGAMGMVRRAYDERLAREVAIKLVLCGSQSRHHGRLLREAQALAQLSHPNVVQVYDVGEIDSKVFIAMELVAGETLKQWQRELHTWRESLEAYLQAGRGLAAAHAVGLVHRDFKPSNCIRDTKGRVRVLDFGLARAVDFAGRSRPSSDEAAVAAVATSASSPAADSSGQLMDSSGTMLQMQLTEKDSVVGTLAYMAPEQYAGRPVDAKSDQFSFCVSLFEALYDELPFSRDPRSALNAMAKGQQPPPAYPEGAHRVPRVLRRALLRGLSGEPDARWPSMEALLQELERPLRTAWWRQVSILLAVAGSTALTTAVLMGGESSPEDRMHLDDLWGADERRQVREALLSAGVPYASDAWEQVRRQVDAYAADWDMAWDETLSDPARFVDQRRCLRRRRASFESTIDELAHADRVRAERAVGAVVSLPSVEDCRAATGPGVSGLDPVSAEYDLQVEQIAASIDRARRLDLLAQYSEGIEQVTQAREQAVGLGNHVLEAKALVVEGSLLEHEEQFDGAEAKFEAASSIAVEEGLAELFIEALSRQGRVNGVVLARSEAGRAQVEVAVGLAKDPASRAMALTAMGDVLGVHGDHRRAEGCYREALEILRDEHGREHLLLARPLDGLAKSLRGQGKLNLAMEHRRRALAINRRWLGDQHPNTAQVRSNIAAILYAQREYRSARQELELAIEILEQAVEADDTRIANATNSLAAVLDAQGEHVQAAALYREVIRIWEQRLAKTHPSVAVARFNLAAALEQQQQIELAIEQYERALRIFDQNESTPDNIRSAAKVCRDLGLLYVEQGQLPTAEYVYREGLERLQEIGLEDDLMAADLHYYLA